MSKPTKNQGPSSPNPNLVDSPMVGKPAMHVPSGRTLADMPKGEPIPPPSGAPKPPNTRLTLRQMITDYESKEYLVGFLKELGTKRKKGPWRSYLEFYSANQSGDVDTMKPDVRAYCEKMAQELNDEYFEAQQL